MKRLAIVFVLLTLISQAFAADDYIYFKNFTNTKVLVKVSFKEVYVITAAARGRFGEPEVPEVRTKRMVDDRFEVGPKSQVIYDLGCDIDWVSDLDVRFNKNDGIRKSTDGEDIIYTIEDEEWDF